jgi:SET domain-containing protein
VDAVLDPANRHDVEIGKKFCKNCALQLDRPLRTFVGESSVHGWGLYAGEDIPMGGFLGRYKGEVISKQEAERRDATYETVGRRYIFSVDEEHDIDAYSVGNKMRFVNEPSDQDRINSAFISLSCHSGMRLVGVVATRDIPRGQEIFVDYGGQ